MAIKERNGFIERKTENSKMPFSKGQMKCDSREVG